MIDQVLSAYGFSNNVSINPHGTGLINRTWIIRNGSELYILQQVNNQVFIRPQDIAENIEMVGRYLSEHYPDIVFPRPVRSLTGKTLVQIDGDKYYRLYPFIANSVTIDVAPFTGTGFRSSPAVRRFHPYAFGFPCQSLA